MPVLTIKEEIERIKGLIKDVEDRVKDLDKQNDSDLFYKGIPLIGPHRRLIRLKYYKELEQKIEHNEAAYQRLKGEYEQQIIQLKNEVILKDKPIIIPPHEHIWLNGSCVHCNLTEKEFDEKTKPKDSNHFKVPLYFEKDVDLFKQEIERLKKLLGLSNITIEKACEMKEQVLELITSGIQQNIDKAVEILEEKS